MIRFQCLNKACNFEQYFLDEDNPGICSACDSKWYRITYCKGEVRSNKGVNYYEQDHPRWSIAMGVPAHQVEQFRARYPDSIYRDDGALYVKGRPDKKRKAKERDMCELN